MQASLKKQIFEDEYFFKIKEYFRSHPCLKSEDFDFYGSKRIDSFEDKVLKEILIKLHEPAKVWFNSKTLLPTYAIFSEYSGEQAMLNKHLDSGPCTYTIDLGLYHETPWPLIVEDKEYEFLENEAVLFYANHQQHWKPEFPKPETNKVGILLIHYAEPDHPWFKLTEEFKMILRKKVKALS
jgi:hypothetical protein